MDLERFQRELPARNHGWSMPAVRLCDGRQQEVLSRVRGMTTPNVLELLNLAMAARSG
jgi:hypothetical protein